MKKQTAFWVMALALIQCLALGAWSEPTELLLDQLGSENKTFHGEAIQAFIAQGAPALPVLIQQVGSENHFLDKFAKQTAEIIVNQSSRPGAETERAAVEQSLMDVLIDGGTPVQIDFTFRMLSRMGTAKSIPVIAVYLRKTANREMARYALERIKGSPAAEAILTVFKEIADVDFQAALIKTLGVIGCPSAVPTVSKAIGSRDYPVRLAAIGAAGRLNDPSVIGKLVDQYRGGFGREKTTAEQSLLVLAEGLIATGQLQDAETIYQVFDQESAPVHLRCAALIGYTKLHGEGSWPRLVLALSDPCEQIRGTAKDLLIQMSGSMITLDLVNALKNAQGTGSLEMIRILAERNDPSAASAAPALVKIALNEKGDLRLAAGKALATIPGDEVSDAVLYALNEASDDQKPDLMRILGARGYHGALQILVKEAQEGNLAEKIAALEALGQIGDSYAAPVVSNALISNNDQIRKTAGTSAISIAQSLLKQKKNKDALDLCLLAMKNVTDEQSLSNLTGILQSLGATGQMAQMVRMRGFVPEWWITGPIHGRDALRTSDVLSPGKVDVMKPVKANGQTLSWQRYTLANPTGMIDLEQAVGSQSDAGAYLYTLVNSSRKQDAVFHLGSDDDLFCWLNGESVHQFVGDRGWNPDQDQVKVTLTKGVNRILLKVLNGGSQWAASVRITDASGNSLPLQQ